MPETKTMDTEPGGETTQYESIKTQNVPTARQTGQLGGDSEHSSSHQPSISKERGEKVAENMRYGQAISEQGVGGMTNSTGATQQSGYGGVEADKREEDTSTAASRRAQGHGPGSGVGA